MIELKNEEVTDAELDGRRITGSAQDLAVRAVVAREVATCARHGALAADLGPLREALLVVVERYLQTGKVAP